MTFQWLHPLYSLAEAATATTTTAADAAGTTAEMTPLAMVIQLAPILLIGVVFYFMLIRPQRKKDKEVKKMLAELKKGDRVTTIGGIHGTIDSIKDDTVTITVGQDKVKLVFARWGIRSVDEVSIANDAETLV